MRVARGAADAVRDRWRAASARARLRVLVGALTVVALGLLVGAAGAAGAWPRPALLPLLVLGAFLLLTEGALLHLRPGSDHLCVVRTAAPVLVGLATLPRPWVVLLAGPLVAASHLLQRRTVPTSVSHGSAATVSAAGAALVLTALLGGVTPDVLRPGHAAALLAAVAAYGGAGLLLSAAVLCVAQDCRLLQVVRAGAPLSGVVLAGSTGVAALVLVVLERAPALLLGVPPLLLVGHLVHRGYVRAGQDRDVWRQLEAASRELNRLQEHEVVLAALRRTRELFRCDDVELVLDDLGRHRARTARLVDGRLVQREQDSGGPRAGQARWLELDDQADERQVTTCLATPLDSPAGRVGALRLLFHGTVALSARERQVLTTFAQSVSTNLQNARLHEDVRAEAARHAYEASHDALTGLANRVLLGSETERALTEVPGTTALLLLDLDHFKEINDTLGHAAGDQLLQEVAQRLRRAVGGGGLVARLGGDEFAVLLTGLAEPQDAEPLAARLLHALWEPVEFEGLRLSVEGSLGLACHPQDAATADELFRRADVAMYQAKTTRGAWLRYDADRDDSSVHRLALVGELRQALERDEVLVHVQPQVDLQTGRIVSAEALCRWQHPTRGLLLPTDFVGVVEQSGLVRPFTLRVLELALQACALWRADGTPLRIAVNLSARSLLDRSLPDDVAEVLARTGVDPQDLVLEITETTATSELEVVEEVLARLRRAGVGISVDDFGTGYSSLAFLQRTAVNELKVDKSFVRGMLSNDNDAALVRATVQLAHSLGARAVAEGVEDLDHARALRDLGCDVAQGFLYGRPVPAARLRERLGAAPVVVPLQGERLLRAQA